MEVVFLAILFLTEAVVTLINWLHQGVSKLGSFTLFVGRIISASRNLWKRRDLFFRHCEYIGVSSTGVIVIAGTFIGAVMGFQLYVALHLFGAEAILGGSVGAALLRELAPVFGAIMVTGRAGAAMAAEVASMRITEQIDALEVMAVDPIEYLVAPRVLAGVLMMPILSAFFGGVGSLSGAAVGCGIMGLSSATYWEVYALYVDFLDITHLIIKSLVFGFLLTAIGCYCGYNAQGGARAVGLATRTTVVASVLAILLSDYLITTFLPVVSYPLKL